MSEFADLELGSGAGKAELDGTDHVVGELGRFQEGTSFGRLIKSSKVLMIVTAMTLAVSAFIAVFLLWVPLRWLAWVEVMLIGVGLALAFATWTARQAEDRFAVRMAIHLNSRRLQAFRDVAVAGGQSLDLQEVLKLGLERVLQVTALAAAEIHLIDPTDPAGTLAPHARAGGTGGEGTMTVEASFGEPEGFLMREEVFVVGECLCGKAVLSDEPLLVPDIQDDPRVTRRSCQRFGFRSAACVPLQVKGRSIGVLTVHGREPRPFGEKDVELLVAVANQLATAIENARLYAEMEARVETLSRELQHMAVVQERERLGREMHDGLAQVLSLLSIQTAQTRSLLLGGEVEQAVQELHEMSHVINAGYEEVREAITNLRLAAPKGAEFVDWLQEYFYEFGLRHNLKTDLCMPLDQSILVLPPNQEVHLTRIIQESLNNVRKHAQASSVRMTLSPNGCKLTLQIEDDGIGFDLEQVRKRRGRYGLYTMQERAELLGGSLDIQSKMGRGTTITVEVAHNAVQSCLGIGEG